jgi:phytol kinase
MVLAIADAGAAIIGRRAGARRYGVLDGARSLEGSLGFFGLAFAVVLIATALAGRPGWPVALVVAFTAAAVATLVEAISVRGTDNLLVPFAVLFVLGRGLDGGGAALEPLLWGLAGSGLVAYAAVQRGQATVSASLAITLVGGTAWALGGPAPTVALFAAWALLRVRSVVPPADLDDIFPTAAGPLVLLLAAAGDPGTPLRGPLLAALAASSAIAFARPARRPIAAAALGAGLPLAVAAALGEDLPYWRIGVISLAGPLAFALLSRSAWWGRRLLASLFAAALAWSFA